jgi:hypothetical protein
MHRRAGDFQASFLTAPPLIPLLPAIWLGKGFLVGEAWMHCECAVKTNFNAACSYISVQNFLRVFDRS